MAFTEIQKRNGKKHYYRTVSVRKGGKVSKRRIFLGTDLDDEKLAAAEIEADMELGVLEALLTPDEIAFLEKVKEEHAREPDITSDNRYEAFTTLFTHDSTAIEGNTLTLQETGSLLFEDITPAGKTFRDIGEVIGHKNAFDLMLEHDGSITRDFICRLHAMVMRDTLSPKFKEQIGNYRTVPVYIRGVEWTPPAPEDVPGEVAILLSWYTKSKQKVHPVVAAIYFHVGFEIVHPFIDGNGRVGRLLLNFILHREGFPMVNIPNARKHRYYDVLEKAQVDGDLRPFIEFVLELFEENEVWF